MIEVYELTKRYGDRKAVDDVSFRVNEGEIVGFLGPNGAGKTTTLRMITGYLAPTLGRVKVGGLDVGARSVEARRLLGYMPEGAPLHPELRVSEYLRYRARLKGVPRAALGGRVEASLGLAGVADVADRIVGQLSKGYRQRVALADALVADPPLLVLDEPTAGLDPNQIRQVRDLVKGFAGKKTVFLSTHILPEVEATCGRVVIIHRGKLVGEGSPEELRARRGAGVLVVVGRAGPDRLRAVLEAVPGVEAVLDVEVAGEGLCRARLACAQELEVPERVFRAAADAGVVLRELTPGEARLEDVFTSLTTEEDVPRSGSAGAGEEAPSPAESEGTVDPPPDGPEAGRRDEAAAPEAAAPEAGRPGEADRGDEADR